MSKEDLEEFCNMLFGSMMRDYEIRRVPYGMLGHSGRQYPIGGGWGMYPREGTPLAVRLTYDIAGTGAHAMFAHMWPVLDLA